MSTSRLKRTANMNVDPIAFGKVVSIRDAISAGEKRFFSNPKRRRSGSGFFEIKRGMKKS